MVESLVAIGMLLFYMLPTLVAMRRKHRNVTPIGIFNFFFGWTILVWIVCLAWANSDNTWPIRGD